MFLKLLLFIYFYSTLYANNLLTVALEKKIHESKQWNNLLHIHNGKTEILDDSFFLSPSKLAYDELLYALTTISHENICHYPARYNFLQKVLNIPQDTIDLNKCTNITKFIQDLNTSTISLVFTSAYINQPASMFGHTFIHLNHSSSNKLLGYAFNFNAIVNNDPNIINYIYKGLTGGFQAQYSLTKYYKKINEYADIEQRDMFEYELSLNPNEKKQFLYHLYELKNRKKTYTFIKYNCAYNILWLLEVAKNESLDKDHFYIFPTETIYKLDQNKWLGKFNIIYSLQSSIKENILHLSNKVFAQDIVNIALLKIPPSNITENTSLSNLDKQLILSTSVLYMRYLVTIGEMDLSVYKQNFLTILKERSYLKEKILLDKKSSLSNPLYAHLPRHVTLKSGTRNNIFATQFSYKFGYHELDDTPNGFLASSGISFLDFTIENSNGKSSLENFTLFQVDSFIPRDVLFKPLSFSLKLALDKEYLKESLYPHLNLGIGQTYYFYKMYLYSLIQADLFIKDTLSPAVGAHIGLIYDINNHHIHTKIEERFYLFSKEQLLISFNDNYKISKNFSLSLNTKLIQRYKYLDKSFFFGINLYH